MINATIKAAVCAFLLCVIMANEARAEQAANTNLFDAAYFAAFSPNTALEMISRIPSFTIAFAENKRGLGQGGANVLINGKRITGKTDAGSQLGRIAAENVVHIEILDGASLDIPGLSGQVANVVTKTSGLTGTWSWEPEFRRRQDFTDGHFHLTLSGELSNWSYSAEVRQESRRNGNWGRETITQADGTLIETRDERLSRVIDIPGVIIDLTWKPDNERIANFNLEYNKFNFSGTEISARNAVTSAGTTLDSVFSRAEDETNGSISADYEFPFAAGKLKTIGYYRFEESPVRTIFNIFDRFGAQEQIDGSRFTQQADESEAILRTEYSWKKNENQDWQAGIEAAFNVLDITAELEILDAAGNFIQEILTGANSRVEEQRAEVTLTHTRTLSEKLDLQFSLGGEYSELIQTGGLQREFTRPKGFIASTYKPDKSLSIRAKIEREVGQLNFFDFISSVNINEDQSTTGNVNLIPSQSWRGELEFDKDFGQGNKLIVTLYGSQISDLVDRIPIGVDGDAVGNIDSASQYGVETNLSILGDQWGWNGTELKIGAEYTNSDVTDPLTGASRRLNGDQISFWEVEFRHDIPESLWAYGFFLEQRKQAPVFRIDSIRQFNFDGPFSSAFIEHKNFFGMKINASVRNIFSGTDDFSQRIFTDRRDLGVLDFTEARSRNIDPFFNVKISGTF